MEKNCSLELDDSLNAFIKMNDNIPATNAMSSTSKILIDDMVKEKDDIIEGGSGSVDIYRKNAARNGMQKTAMVDEVDKELPDGTVPGVTPQSRTPSKTFRSDSADSSTGSITTPARKRQKLSHIEGIELWNSKMFQVLQIVLKELYTNQHETLEIGKVVCEMAKYTEMNPLAGSLNASTQEGKQQIRLEMTEFIEDNLVKKNNRPQYSKFHSFLGVQIFANRDFNLTKEMFRGGKSRIRAEEHFTIDLNTGDTFFLGDWFSPRLKE